MGRALCRALTAGFATKSRVRNVRTVGAIGRDWSSDNFPASGSDGIYTGHYLSGGSFVNRSDGKILATFVDGNYDVYLTVVDSEEDALFVDESFLPNKSLFYTKYSSSSKKSDSILFKIANGDILLFISEKGVLNDGSKPSKVMMFRCTDGLGATFTFEVDLKSFSLAGYTSGMNLGNCTIGQPLQLNNGRILVSIGVMAHYSGVYSKLITYCAYSDNDGVSWGTGIFSSTTNTQTVPLGLGIAGSQIIGMQTYWPMFGSNRLLYSSNNGETWTAYTDINTMYGSRVFALPDGYTYLVKSPQPFYIYRRLSSASITWSGTLPYERGDIGSGATWELQSSIIGDDSEERLWQTESSNLCYMGTSNYGGYNVIHNASGKYAVTLRERGTKFKSNEDWRRIKV